MKRNSEGFIPILVIVVLALVAVTGYFVYKNHNTNFNASTKLSISQSSIATPSSTPLVTSTNTPSATPINKTFLPKPTTSTLIDCVGPDGKHAKATQADCDNLNSFWNSHSSSGSQSNSSSSNSNNSGSTSNNQSSSTFTTTTNPTPSSQMGYTFSSDSINMTVKNDGSVTTAFTFTSTGSTSFEFNGSPQYQGGINWTAASGGNFSGEVMQEGLQVYQNVPVGVYQGIMVFTDETKNVSKSFPTSITVTN